MNVSESSPSFSWLQMLIPLIAGLAGVFIGAWLTSRRERRQRRHEFVAKQLSHFYSPLLGLRKETIVRSNLRSKIHDSADVKWRALCEEARLKGGEAALKVLDTDREPEFRRLIEFENRQVTEELMPTNKRILGLFRENLWLADKDTQQFLPRLIEYVELWERWLARVIPTEVLEDIDTGGGSIRGLDEHLQEKHDKLQEKLRSGAV